MDTARAQALYEPLVQLDADARTEVAAKTGVGTAMMWPAVSGQTTGIAYLASSQSGGSANKATNDAVPLHPI
jgi:hypothetical protein